MLIPKGDYLTSVSSAFDVCFCFCDSFQHLELQTCVKDLESAKQGQVTVAI